MAVNSSSGRDLVVFDARETEPGGRGGGEEKGAGIGAGANNTGDKAVSGAAVEAAASQSGTDCC